MANDNYSKPLLIDEIFKKSASLFFGNFATYMKLFFLLFLPPGILYGIILVFGDSISFLIVFLFAIAIFTLFILGFVALIKQTEKLLEGETHFAFSTIMKESSSYFFKIIGLAILMGFLLLLLTLLLVIPAIIFSIYWVFAFFALIIKNTSVTDSLSYSKGLVKGRWFHVVGYLITFSLLSLIVSIPIIGIAYLPLLFGAPFLTPIFSIILTIPVSLFFLVVKIVFFKNMDGMFENKQEPTTENSPELPQ